MMTRTILALAALLALTACGGKADEQPTEETAAAGAQDPGFAGDIEAATREAAADTEAAAREAGVALDAAAATIDTDTADAQP